MQKILCSEKKFFAVLSLDKTAFYKKFYGMLNPSSPGIVKFESCPPRPLPP